MYVKVKFLKPHPKYSYFPGDNGEVTEDAAADLLKGAFIMLLPNDEDPKENPLPEDCPARDKLFAAGFETVEKAQEAGESLKDAKLTKNEIKAVMAYEVKPKENPLPEDCPARDKLFAAGFETVEKAQEAGESLKDAELTKEEIEAVMAFEIKPIK